MGWLDTSVLKTLSVRSKTEAKWRSECRIGDNDLFFLSTAAISTPEISQIGQTANPELLDYFFLYLLIQPELALMAESGVDA